MGKRKTIRQKKSARVWQLILGVLCLVGISALVYIVYFSPLFRVRNVIVRLENTSCTNESSMKSSVSLLNKWVFMLDKSFESDLKRKFSCIQKISSHIILPNSIQINASGIEPLATIKMLTVSASQSAVLSEPQVISSDSAKALRQSMLDFSNMNFNNTYIVDSEGVVFAIGEEPSLPVLFLSGFNLKVGEVIQNSLVKNAVTILKSIQVLNLNANSSKVIGGVLVVNSEPKLLFALERDIKDQLASLQLILQEAKMEDASMEFIDLRFKNPVVKYIDKKKGN